MTVHLNVVSCGRRWDLEREPMLNTVTKMFGLELRYKQCPMLAPHAFMAWCQVMGFFFGSTHIQ